MHLLIALAALLARLAGMHVGRNVPLIRLMQLLLKRRVALRDGSTRVTCGAELGRVQGHTTAGAIHGDQNIVLCTDRDCISASVARAHLGRHVCNPSSSPLCSQTGFRSADLQGDAGGGQVHALLLRTHLLDPANHHRAIARYPRVTRNSPKPREWQNCRSRGQGPRMQGQTLNKPALQFSTVRQLQNKEE